MGVAGPPGPLPCPAGWEKPDKGPVEATLGQKGQNPRAMAGTWLAMHMEGGREAYDMREFQSQRNSPSSQLHPYETL